MEGLGIYHHFHYYMVTTCLPEASELDRKKCISRNILSLENSNPVIGADEHLYANMFCARCNFVKEFQFVSIEMKCSHIGVNVTRRQCVSKIALPDSLTIKSCSRLTRSRRHCPESNKYYHRCHSYVGLYRNYSNYFCRLCDHEDTVTITMDDMEECRLDYTEHQNFPFSWMTVLQLDDFETQRFSPHALSDPINCDPQKSFLTLVTNPSCFHFLCPPGYQATNHNKCVERKVIHHHAARNQIHQESPDFDKCFAMRSLTLFARNIKSLLNVLDVIIDLDVALNVSLITNNDATIAGITNATVQFVLSEEFVASYALSPSGSILISDSDFSDYQHHQHNLTYSQIFPDGRICVEPIQLEKNVSTCGVDMNTSITRQQNINVWIEIRRNRVLKNTFICNRFYLTRNCSLKLIESNFTLLSDNTLTYINANGDVYNYDTTQYMPDKSGGYVVCLSPTYDVHVIPWFETIQRVSGYISLVGSACSILCYISFMFTIAYFKELQRFPGYIASALNASLLLGDGMFLLSNSLFMYKQTPHHAVCEFIGILMHFSLLLAQVTGVVIAFDIFNNITKVYFLSTRSRSEMIKYCAISLVVPFMIIVFGTGLRELGVVDFSYSQHGACMLHGFYARVALYFIPLVMCFVTSLTFIMLAINYISKVKRTSVEVLRIEQGRLILRVALKLIFLCGVPEGVGFINSRTTADSSSAVYVFNAVFGILYSALKGFRGVFMFASYVCSNSVTKLFRER